MFVADGQKAQARKVRDPSAPRRGFEKREPHVRNELLPWKVSGLTNKH